MPKVAMLDHFDALTKFGIKVIPLRENSKHPANCDWNQNWNGNKCREYIQRFPESNIGILLGNIIDVEGDSKESNEKIINLIGDYPHPTYQSNRSFHHLFQNPDPKLKIFKVNDIEFRGHKHQSVLPPSQYKGIEYKWLKQFKFPIPEMPKTLLSFYKNKRMSHKVIPGNIKLWCSKCKNKFSLHKQRFNLELKVFRMLDQKWQCHKCRKIDLRPICRMIRNGEDVSLPFDFC